ncbi:MAG: DUF2804 domain-containing protein [Candidatus Lokiarchaeota archaeon]|nr:DUF2804 domain-containing protein [Candidatus Lokiarchaeota archaeon]
MQDEITERTDILGDDGRVVRPGWARDDLFNYDRKKIRSNSLRIKEWDFWEAFNDNYRVVLNIFDIGFAGVAQFTLTDFNTGVSTNASMLRLLTRGSVGNPPSWRYEPPLCFAKGGNRMEFSRKGDDIHLRVEFPKKEIEGEIALHKDPRMDSMVNLIPFENPRQFVYAVKIACMPAEGQIRVGGTAYPFNEANNSWGVLDWTRAVFPYKNHWKWCISSGRVNGVPLGFNIDYGFGTESSKSMIIYDGKGHHLDVVEYQHDPKHLEKPLRVTSPDKRVDLTLVPKFHEKTGVDIGFLAMKGINTYGYFTGQLLLDDGTAIQVKESDRLFGWAEEFYQKW